MQTWGESYRGMAITDDVDLDHYFERIGYGGSTAADLDTLRNIHRAHLTSVPYENLEIQLGHSKTIAETAFFDLIVRRRRGGWCYEMNGLLTAVLHQLGFIVTRVGGAVARNLLQDAAIGNHLVGLIDLDGARFVADVGLGDGPMQPFELTERTWQEGELAFGLEKLDDEWWRFHNHPNGLAQTFDFTEKPRPLQWYEPMCRFLQTDPASPFVNYAITSRRTENGARSLRDTSLIEIDGNNRQDSVIDNEQAYSDALADILGCDIGADVTRLWSKVTRRAQMRAAEEPDSD